MCDRSKDILSSSIGVWVSMEPRRTDLCVCIGGGGLKWSHGHASAHDSILYRELPSQKGHS